MGLKKRSEEHTSELQSQFHIVCRLLLEKKKINKNNLNQVVINIHLIAHYMLVCITMITTSRRYTVICFMYIHPHPPPKSTLFPTRRSSDLQSELHPGGSGRNSTRRRRRRAARIMSMSST